jgi:hypothetical protein
VVVVHGCVTVTVVGCVTVTVTVVALRSGQTPRLSLRRRCAFTALLAKRIVTGSFEALRWHMATFGRCGSFFAPARGPATAKDVPSPNTKTAARTALTFIYTTWSQGSTAVTPRAGTSQTGAT